MEFRDWAISKAKKYQLDPVDMDSLVAAVTKESCTEDLEFQDNYRLALTTNDHDMFEYEQICSGGCCGFLDRTLNLPSGKTIKFGFNYGH